MDISGRWVVALARDIVTSVPAIGPRRALPAVLCGGDFPRERLARLATRFVHDRRESPPRSHEATGRLTPRMGRHVHDRWSTERRHRCHRHGRPYDGHRVRLRGRRPRPLAGERARVSILRLYSLARPTAGCEHADVYSRRAAWPREALDRLPALAMRTRYRPDAPVDVFHATETLLRPIRATAVVATIHDLGALRRLVPAAGEALVRARAAFDAGLERADCILTFSAASLPMSSRSLHATPGKHESCVPG